MQKKSTPHAKNNKTKHLQERTKTNKTTCETPNKKKHS